MKQHKYVTNNQWTTRGMSVWERFWSKVDCPEHWKLDDIAPPYRPRTKCWPWLAAKTPEGYGLFWLNGKYVGAHRTAYELGYGHTVAEDLELDHLCRNPSCVRPSHLEAVTRQVNQLRSNSVSGRGARKTHCPQGHPYSPENTYVFRTGRGGLGRQCRTCSRERTKKWAAKKRAERRKS